MTRPRRILHVITRLEQGGAPLALLETTSRMDRSAFDLTIAAGETEEGAQDLDLTRSGFDLPILRVPSMRRSIHPLRDAIALIQLIRIIAKGDYDLVHTHTSKAGLLGRIAASLCGTRAIIHSSHGTILQGYFSPQVTRLFAAMERFAATLSDRIICLTSQEIEQYLDVHIGSRGQYTCVCNGIDLDAFEQERGDRGTIREEFGFSDEDVVCVTVGRLVPVKAQADLLEALATARQYVPSLKLLVVGDGELRDDLEAQRHQLGLTTSVKLAGWREDIPRLLDACDVFVLTSLNEGLGLVLVEAMAKKLPVIATAVGGVPEVVDDGVTGVLLPAGDVGSIAKAIQDLAADPELRASMGGAGHARAHELFSLNQAVRNTEAIYRELLPQP